MPVLQSGSINTTALIVPDLYVQIVPPQVTGLNGVPTNLLGIVGIASWGPVNAPVPASDMAGYSAVFGPILDKKYDLGTAMAAAVLQGANNFSLVRVTDGTDTAATTTLTCPDDPTAVAVAAAINSGVSGVRGPSRLVIATASLTTVTVTSIYTGTYGNKTVIAIGPGSAATTTKVTVSMPGGVPEVFDNIGAASAVAATPTMASGTDGNTTITATVLLGDDTTTPLKGMYALRNTRASVAFLADVDDPTTWTNQAAFALSEGIYMVTTGPAGQTSTTAVSAKTSANVDSYGLKILMGDWCYFQDTVNNKLRLISPQGFAAGRLANLSPEQSGLNKPIYGIVNTQTTATNRTLSTADLAKLVAAGIDVITAPAPGGNYFALRIGHNCSSNPMINGDSYTRMTNYIAYTIAAGMGIYDGRVATFTERAEAFATLDGFFSAMKNTTPDPMIEDYSIKLNESNNPQAQRALGYQKADVKVQYLGIVEKFIINVEGGASVVVRQITQ